MEMGNSFMTIPALPIGIDHHNGRLMCNARIYQVLQQTSMIQMRAEGKQSAQRRAKRKSEKRLLCFFGSPSWQKPSQECASIAFYHYIRTNCIVKQCLFPFRNPFFFHVHRLPFCLSIMLIEAYYALLAMKVPGNY
jgi:hypothetical protein